MRLGIRMACALGVILAVLTLAGRAQQPPAAPAPPAQNPNQPAPGQPPDTQEPAPDQPPGNQIPVFRGGTNFVRVDVIATDSDGQPVMDLTVDDFELAEDGKAQPIEAFKLVEVNSGLLPGPEGPPRPIRTDADETTEAARDDVRLIGIFLDDYHVRDMSSLRARLELVQFVETQLVPTDMVTLMYPLEPIASVRFTRNHRSIAAGLSRFIGRKYDYEPMNEIERGYVYRLSTEAVERIRNEVSLGALKALIIRMGGLKEGRKSLILVSEGYTNVVPPQLRSDVAGTFDPFNAARRDPSAGTTNLDQRLNFMANLDMDVDLREVYDLANKNNVAIYAVDPRGLGGSEFGADQPNISIRADWTQLRELQETLRTLSLTTDGAAIINRNDIAVAMQQIVRDSNAYYLLGYTGAAPSDGKFHEIRVRVRRPGVQIRYRQGYWAPTDDTAVRTSATLRPRPGPPAEIEAAFAAMATTTVRQRVIRTWIGTSRGDNGRTRVTVSWEPSQAAPAGPGRPSAVSLMATSQDGAPIYRGRLVSAAPAAGAPSGGARASFDAPPGRIQLRVSVEDPEADVLDSEVRDFDVPDLTAPETLLATPVLFRARTAREVQQIKADLQAALPTASREFRRTEQVLVRLTAYGAGSEKPALSARILNRDGKPVIDLPIAEVAGGPLAELNLAPLALGDYVLEIVAGAEDAPTRALIGFRVTG
jgi:VWFA-related protein